MPVRFRPRAPQIRPEASTSFRPFSFSLWEVALTSARTCAEVCRNPGVCGGTNGGTFWKSGGTSLHVPPTRAAQAGPLVLVGCLMTPVARHYPPGWPCHNLTPLGRVTQQCAGAARITRTAQSQGEPTSGGAGVHRPPSTLSKRDALAHRWGSNYPHCTEPGRNRAQWPRSFRHAHAMADPAAAPHMQRPIMCIACFTL